MTVDTECVDIQSREKWAPSASKQEACAISLKNIYSHVWYFMWIDSHVLYLTNSIRFGWFLFEFQREHILYSESCKNIFFIIILFDHESNHHSFKVYLIFIHTSQTQVVFHPKKAYFLPILAVVCVSFGCGWIQKTTRCAEVFFIWRLGVLYSSGLMGKHGIPCLRGLMLLHNSYISCLRPTDK